MSTVAFHRSKRTRAIELSALREWELGDLVRAAAGLDVSNFEYVSIHAPSSLQKLSEEDAVEMLTQLPERWNIVVHPDVVKRLDVWRSLEHQLCFENMDQRKKSGRTVAEIAPLLVAFSKAGFCLDLGHAHQIDPTMGVAIEMLCRYGDRLRQVHVSEVTPHGRHIGLTFVTQRSFARIAHLIPNEVPLIIESVVAEAGAELTAVREAFESASHRVIKPSRRSLL
ncbi:MAG TPA: hypothetical protein VN380_26415 [Thermoanaerobaculia bacterium]|nr:hypothetical protein [Thermoanaerobaculia bacterium]